MEIKRYEGNGRMSRAVVHMGTIYLCGQTAGDANKNIKEQTQAVLEKVEELLDKYDSTKQHILSVTIYLKDISMFKEMNEVWDSWIEKGFEPARACVEAKMAREDILVEVSVVAAVR